MRSFIKSTIVAVGLALSAGAALAATYPAPLQAAVAAGTKVEKSFKTPAGLTGWVIQQGAKYNIVYTTPDGNYLIAGALIDAEGKNLTSQYMEDEVPKPDYSSAWSKLQKAAYVAEGASDKEARNTIYVVSDPQCPYCHQIWSMVQPYEAKGLQVRWIKVAILGPQSTAKAAAILSAKDPAAALRAHNQAMDVSTGPAAVSNDTISQAVKDKLADNRRLMQELGFSGTPGVIYKDAAGVVRVVNGTPSAAQLAKIVRLD